MSHDPRAIVSSQSRVKPTPAADPAFDLMVRQVQERLEENLKRGAVVMTDADQIRDGDRVLAGRLQAVFVAHVADPQHHNCRACGDFLRRYGALAVVDEHGTKTPLLWFPTRWFPTPEMPTYYREAIAALHAVVLDSPVCDVFLSGDKDWGKATAGGWTHLAVTPPPEILHASPIVSASQAMAAKREDFAILRRGLAAYAQELLDRVAAWLESGALCRSEAVVGAARWLRDLKRRHDAARGLARDNIIWHAVATATPAYTHPQTGVLGTLLDDLAGGLSFDDASRRFAAKMDPTQYMRPQAPATAGNIAAAEKIVEALGIAPSLGRRYARLEEVKAVWKPRPAGPAAPAAGVFGHLRPEATASRLASERGPRITMTWEKFRRTVLPEARSIEAAIGTAEPFAAITTAADADAPPLLQWDTPGRRNPASWYTYSAPTGPLQWNLRIASRVPVTAITLMPPQWDDEAAYPRHGRGILVLLEGAREQDYRREIGSALFPEHLRHELHEVRATIEAHSRKTPLAGRAEASACGLMYRAGVPWSLDLRVTTPVGVQDYRIDRWD